MAKVTGVGGVFLRSANPKALGAWYAKHLGVEVGDYGATFMWKDEVPKDLAKVRLYRSGEVLEQKSHYRNFLDCVKSRKPTITPVETAHHSLVPGHLALIAMMVGRKIKWDAKKGVIVGDKEASKLLGREYRAPWKLA